MDDPQAIHRNFLRFTNCRLLPPDSASESLLNSDLLVDVDRGTVTRILARDEHINDSITRAGGNNVELLDCEDNILSPGFIDLQLNGAWGVDFSDANKIDAESVRRVARKLPATGVTAFSPTLISCSRDEYRKILPVIGPLCLCHKDNADGIVQPGACEIDGEADIEESSEREMIGATPLGVHLEGPFFAPTKHGAHPLVHIVDPADGFDTVCGVYGTSSNLRDCGVSTVTVAPEREGALSAVRSMAQCGLVVSMGHTDATLEEGREGIRHGVTLITHLFNAMKPFHHREPAFLGLLTDGGTDEKNDLPQRPYFSIIADGVHVHPTAVSIARSVHPSGAVLITDAMSAMGLGDGKHTLGDTHVEVSGMRATVVGSDTLAGSVASMDFCVRSYKSFAGCSVVEALRAATLNPAKALGCDNIRGKLAPGYIADLVLLDGELSVVGTWLGGKPVFSRST